MCLYIGSSFGPLLVSQKIHVPSFHLQKDLDVSKILSINFFKIVSISGKGGLLFKYG